MHHLEMVQRSAARIIMQILHGDRQSMTTILQQWLPVRKHITFKLFVLYLAALLVQLTPLCSLLSAGRLLLQVPKVNLERFGCRAFAYA